MENIEHKHFIVMGKMKSILSVDEVTTFLESLIVLLDMKKMEAIMPNPNVGYQSGTNGGVTGVAIITTSHLAIHTWDNTLEFQLDVYSCKEYNVSLVIELLKDYGLELSDWKLFDRKYQITEEYRYNGKGH